MAMKELDEVFEDLVTLLKNPDVVAALTARGINTSHALVGAEGLSVRVVPPIGYGEKASLRDERTLYVPTGKAHVAREILRKI
jgi:hypothetical protein